ncbi:hypothetical protein [Streptomyces minutiscleroticus]|uniref:hypothetical protein n=1 Tax=Streptomyces minutiscleroticus TaxID=68238 RepID=UPI0033267BF7
MVVDDQVAYHGEQPGADGDEVVVVGGEVFPGARGRFLQQVLGLVSAAVQEAGGCVGGVSTLIVDTGCHAAIASVVPFIRVDDEISAMDRLWVDAGHPGPSLLHRVDPTKGLVEADFSALTDWIRAVTPG